MRLTLVGCAVLVALAVTGCGTANTVTIDRGEYALGYCDNKVGTALAAEKMKALCTKPRLTRDEAERCTEFRVQTVLAMPADQAARDTIRGPAQNFDGKKLLDYATVALKIIALIAPLIAVAPGMPLPDPLATFPPGPFIPSP